MLATYNPVSVEKGRGGDIPITANSQVQDNKQRAMRQRRPDTLITQLPSAKGMVNIPIHRPLDNLLGPVITTPINLDRPGMEPIPGRDPDRTSLPGRLVADASGEDAAVRCAVSRELAVDLLEDVELAALRPAGAVVDGVAEHPEGGPDALLGGVGA